VENIILEASELVIGGNILQPLHVLFCPKIKFLKEACVTLNQITFAIGLLLLTIYQYHFWGGE
jgi:hypothetical protein